MKELSESSYLSYFTEYPDIVSVYELSQMLGICRVSAYELVNSGRIKGIKIGRIWRIPKRSIYQYLEDTMSNNSNNMAQ